MLMKAPRGTNDILPAEVPQQQLFEEKVRRFAIYSGITRSAHLFLNILNCFMGRERNRYCCKEMYTFDRGKTFPYRDRKGRLQQSELIQHKYTRQPIKVYYLGPMFRYDCPAGRYRQFHQFS